MLRHGSEPINVVFVLGGHTMSEDLDPKWSVERAVLAAKMPHPSKLVMLVMLSHLRHPRELYLNGSSPGQRKLAEETCLSLPAVQEHLRLLEEHGWLVPHRQPKGKRSQYELAAGEDFGKPRVTKEVSHSRVTKPVSQSGGVTKEISQSVTKEVSHSDQPDWSRLEKSYTRSKSRDLEGGKPGKSKPSTGLSMSGPAPWDEDSPSAPYDQDRDSRRKLEAYDLSPDFLKPSAPAPEDWETLTGPASPGDSEDPFEQMLNLSF